MSTSMQRVLTLILGGGAGTRLYPLTQVRAKPAVPVAGKYRLIDIALSNCINSGLRRVFVLTQYLSASLNRHISQSFKFDDFSEGFVDILAAEQRIDSNAWFEGTADAIRKMWGILENHDCDLILILPGDALYLMNYREMVEQHIRQDAELTIALNTVHGSCADQFGLAKIDPWSRVTNFVEKPKTPEAREGYEVPKAILSKFDGNLPQGDTFLASMGVYLFSRATLDAWMRETTLKDFGKDIIPEAIRRNRVLAHIHNGYWEDIGTIEAFYKAHMMMLDDNPPFDFTSLAAPIYTRSRNLPNSLVRTSTIDRAILAPGVNIEGATIRRAIVGLRSKIGKGTVLEESIHMGSDYYEASAKDPLRGGAPIPLGVGQNCVIRRAIVDKNTRIGNNVKILNERNIQEEDGPNYCIRNGIVLIPKNSVLPDGTVI